MSPDLRLFAIAEWRARWRAHLVSAGIVAITVGIVVAVLLAADRSTTAFDRLRTTTNASDVTLFLPEGNDDLTAARAAALRVPGVVAATGYAEPFVRPRGTEFTPDYDLYPIVRFAEEGVEPLDIAVITSGRAVDPTRLDEVVVSEALAGALSLRPGDSMQLESMSNEWIQKAFTGGDPGPPDGPVVDVAIVGIARTPADFGRYKGVLEVTPAFVEKYGDQIRVYRSIHAQLAPGVDGQSLPLGDSSAVSFSAFGDDASTDDGLNTIAKALRVVAFSAALAGIGAAAIAYNRACRVALQDRTTLAAMGWSPSRQQAAVGLALLPWLLGSLPVGAAAGIVGSRFALMGLADRTDPHPDSIVVTWALVVIVMAAALAVALLVLFFAAQYATAVRKQHVASYPARGLWRPLAVSMGIRNAFFAAPRYGGRASRGALVVATLSVAAIVAALSVTASIANLQDHPSLTGQGDDRIIDSGESVDTYDRAFPILERDERVAVLASVHVLFDLEADSVGNVAAIAFETVRGEPDFSVVRGRVPYQPDELGVGPTTLDRLAKSIGDTVILTGPAGQHVYSIVGTILFPEGDFSHDEGIALTVAGAARIAGDVHESGALHQVLFDWRNGVDIAAAENDLALQGFQVLTTEENGLAPAAVTNLDQVRSLPIALAVFVGLLALGTLTQAIATFTKMQRREFATMRALGAKPRTISALVVGHGILIALGALVIGGPAGAVVGAQVWRPIADSANVVVDTISPWQWITTMSGIALISSALLVMPFAVRAMKREPAPYLRAE
ncbi:MAG: ABC transporter permease [Acidimicrobiales bacterium]